MDNEKMKKAILETVAYFDLFDHPLTTEEIGKYLWDPASCELRRINLSTCELCRVNLMGVLSELVERGEIGFGDSYYFLIGRENNVAERQRRVKIAEKKLKMAVRGIKKMRWIPFVRAVFVCNTLSLGTAEEDSDIDVFIIIKENRIWLARLLMTILLQIFGLRRHGKKIKDRICLSFYLADNNLNLAPIALPEPDIYLIYWLDGLMPIYDPNNLRDDLLLANKWAKKYLPNGLNRYEIIPRLKVVDNKITRGWRWFWERAWSGAYGNLVEKQAKQIQITKMKFRRNELESANKGVIINDGMLKFHENDRRECYKKKWEGAVLKMSNF